MQDVHLLARSNFIVLDFFLNPVERTYCTHEKARGNEVLKKQILLDLESSMGILQVRHGFILLANTLDLEFLLIWNLDQRFFFHPNVF